MIVLDGVLIGIAALLLIPCAVVLVECLVAVLPSRPMQMPPDDERPSVGVVVPAHNEETVVAETLASILPQLRASDRLIVVADNCTDGTAAAASAAGATVVERADPQRRGKGYALEFGLRHLRAAPPDVVLFADADCHFAAGAVDALVRGAAQHGRPVQAAYLMQPAPGREAQQSLPVLAFAIKNLARPAGLQRLGLPCLLTGTGMAFPWDIIADAPLASGNIVEDMQLGIDLAVTGHAPRFCASAHVTGVLPGEGRAQAAQRTRWEHGHLGTLLGQGPRLLAAALRQRRLGLLALALELCVPPLALLVLLLLGVGMVATVVALLGASWLPATLLAVGLLALASGVLAGWYRFARRAIPLRTLLGVPLYALAKLPVYLRFVRRPERAWVKTERDLRPG